MKAKNRNHKAILSAAFAALLVFASPAFAVDLSAPYNSITSPTFSSTNGQANTVTGRFDWASGYGHGVNGDFNAVFGFQNVTTTGNFGSILINGANNSIGGYGNTVFGVSNTAGNGTQACFINGLSNTVGTAAAATGILCWVGGQNNLVTGRGTLAFGTFLSDGGLFGTTLLSDYNPFSLRTATARRTATVSDSLTAVFNNGYSWRVNDGQGANPNAGLFLKPSAANTAATSSPAFVGINTLAPTQALDVIGNGNFTGNVITGGSVTASDFIASNSFTASGVNGSSFLNAGFTPGGGTVLMGILTGAANGPQLRFQKTSGAGFIDIGQDANDNFVIEGSDVARVTVTQAGNVGIGTPTPTQALLVVAGSTTNAQNTGRYFDGATNALTDLAGAGHSAYSIFASNRIAATSFDAVSDARIKRIEGRSDAVGDLNTLMQIEVTNYKFKDTIAKGSRPQKKVIAQQVEQVYPQAINQFTDVVPDIYEKATVKDGWVKLATNLKKGDRVRLMGEKSEGIHEVIEVAQDSFRTDFATDGNMVFVYGREVKDFRTVDYEAISMLNVSATQELARKVDAKDAEIAALKKQLAALEARDEARETRLARLEAAGKDHAPRAVPASFVPNASAQ